MKIYVDNIFLWNDTIEEVVNDLAEIQSALIENHSTIKEDIKIYHHDSTIEVPPELWSNIPLPTRELSDVMSDIIPTHWEVSIQDSGFILGLPLTTNDTKIKEAEILKGVMAMVEPLIAFYENPPEARDKPEKSYLDTVRSLNTRADLLVTNCNVSMEFIRMFDQVILNLGAMLLNYPNLGTYHLDYEEKNLKNLFNDWKTNNKDISEQMKNHLMLLERRLFDEDESWEYDEDKEEEEEEDYGNYHDIDEDILDKMRSIPKASSKLRWWERIRLMLDFAHGGLGLTPLKWKVKSLQRKVIDI